MSTPCGAVMVRSRRAVAGDRIIEPMLDLARCSNLNRIIVAGANSAALMFEVHRRGYVRVATTANCGLPAGQYDVALVDWRERSIKALDTALDWLLDFLTPVVWVDPQEPAANRKLRAMLEKHGAGTVARAWLSRFGAALGHEGDAEGRLTQCSHSVRRIGAPSVFANGFCCCCVSPSPAMQRTKQWHRRWPMKSTHSGGGGGHWRQVSFAGQPTSFAKR